MIGLPVRGARPGEFSGRSKGRWALRHGRHDLLKAAPSLNAGRGRGQVVRYQVGQVTVGGAPEMVLFANHRRKRVRLANITHLNANGTESSAWVFKNGKWQTPDGQTAISARLAWAFEKRARDGDAVLEVGAAMSNDENTGKLWVAGVGTPGAVVRYQVAEMTVFPLW